MNMKGIRKFLLGVLFVLCNTALAIILIISGEIGFGDLSGVATVIGAQAGGLGVIVWGNAKEHQAQAQSRTNGL